MGSLAKKLKKRNQLVENRAHKPKDGRYRQLDFETDQIVNRNKAFVVETTRRYAMLYFAWVLKHELKISNRYLKSIGDKVASVMQAVTAKKVDVKEIQRHIIQTKDNDGCNMPDYKPEMLDFDAEFIKFKQHSNIKQALVDTKAMFYDAQVKQGLEIMMILALRDVLGWSKVRLTRFVEKYREMWHIDNFQKLADMVKTLREHYKVETDLVVDVENKKLIEVAA